MKQLVVVLTAIMLSACAGGQIAKTKSFDAGAETALVVLSIKSNGSGLSSPLITWSGFDPETLILGEEQVVVRKRTDNDAGDVMLTMLTGVRDWGGKHYYIFEVPPGGHFISRVQSSSGSGYATIKADTLYKSNTPAFEVEAGGVYFVGDFSYRLTNGNNIIRPVKPDFDAALDVMKAEYPNVVAKVENSPARLVTLNCRAMKKNVFGSDTDYCAPGETDIVYNK